MQTLFKSIVSALIYEMSVFSRFDCEVRIHPLNRMKC